MNATEWENLLLRSFQHCPLCGSNLERPEYNIDIHRDVKHCPNFHGGFYFNGTAEHPIMSFLVEGV